jgi:hypothetical protein|tara:strand:- start:715 stop:1527 length:813 start_codon:yes stop_codon:yes gene_type:complete
VIGGNVHHTYVVEQNVDRTINCIANYKRTYWFDRSLGVVVKDRIEQTGNRRLGAKTSEVQIAGVHFPPGTPVAARPEPLRSVPTVSPATASSAPTEHAANFSGPPKGTVIEYDTWTCEVSRSTEFELECRDPEHGRVGFYGGFETTGSYADIPPLKALVPLMSYNLGYESDKALPIRGFALNAEARAAIESLWPLKPGIPVELRPRLFDKFVQADASASRRRGGTGLGLSIAKAIVEGMNGRIGFQNGSPDGTVFYFELPLVSASEAASR